jgi:hypothetical protein
VLARLTLGGAFPLLIDALGPRRERNATSGVERENGGIIQGAKS